jgi:hypothetical protein
MASGQWSLCGSKAAAVGQEDSRLLATELLKVQLND